MPIELSEGDGGAPVAAGHVNATQARDFADMSTPIPSETSSQRLSINPTNSNQPSPHVHYALNIDTNPQQPLARVDTETPFSPGIRRRFTRAATFRTISDFEDFSERPGWRPGAEPGVDPSKLDGGHGSMTTLHADCDITIVDFSEDHIEKTLLHNETLEAFLNRPQPSWAKCRWINVNGLSWDVIQTLGHHKNLHRLAIEDIMNTRNRTKVEWYPTHAFVVLTLQKLIRRFKPGDDSDSDDDASGRISSHSALGGRYGKRFKQVFRRLKRTNQGDFRGARPPAGLENGNGPYAEEDFGRKDNLKPQPTGFSDVSEPEREPEYRTLQGYHASPNLAWTKFMEKNSALASRKLDVACEQVSMFITNDNTIISFFEQSAQDVEDPIIQRLELRDTITRQTCDASMVLHAIIDAIIDLTIPVTTCYSDVIDDIELDVLNRPDISQTKKLYIVVSEINKLHSFVAPITTLIQALRDHKTDLSLDAAMTKILDPKHPAVITTQTYMYLGDVLDHCVLITDTLDKLKGTADGMIDLIFNTLSAHQNESMKQLTIATIIFLPLTFITGYFGQNFDPFDAVLEGIGLFWKIAVPVVVFTILVLLWEPIYDYCRALLQRRYLSELKARSLRRRRRKRA
ncbi:putative transporter [Cladorrhinum sp. PSN259]|nr:putative transporter [Cladorrhinum sp. PSN259]